MSKYTAFRCPEDLLEMAKIKAKKDRRSLSNYIITLIERDVRDMSPAERFNGDDLAHSTARSRKH
jgi:predicted DNA-binding protein